MSTARGRSSLIPSRVSPRRATLRAGESLGGSNPAAREPLRAGESSASTLPKDPWRLSRPGDPSKLTAGEKREYRTLRTKWFRGLQRLGAL